MHRIAIIPGDGIGLEVVQEGLKVLEAAAAATGLRYQTETYDLGGDRYLKTGEVLPDAAAVVNPRRRDCAYPFKHLTGVALALTAASFLLMFLWFSAAST